MRWPCRGDTGKLISPCSDGATCSRSFLRFDHEKRHHDKQQECGDQSIFERHRAYPSRKHSWARRCAVPALAGCARAVSGHVATVHIGSFFRRGNPDPRMSLVGQKEKPPFSALCQLPPAADMPLDELRDAPIPDPSRCSIMRATEACFAVGTRVTSRPPHRSVRAAFPHTAPTSGIDGKSLP